MMEGTKGEGVDRETNQGRHLAEATQHGAKSMMVQAPH
jgi:hypothetical protein